MMMIQEQLLLHILERLLSFTFHTIPWQGKCYSPQRLFCKLRFQKEKRENQSMKKNIRANSPDFDFA